VAGGTIHDKVEKPGTCRSDCWCLPYLSCSFTGSSKLPTVDLTGYRPQPGLQAAMEQDTLTVRWDGETQRECLARFAIVDGVPTLGELSVRKRNAKWVTLGRNLVPEFGVTTGVRRTGHGLPESNRWDVFWDAPLNNAKRDIPCNAGTSFSSPRSQCMSMSFLSS
jgi:hypothetical protein